MTATDNDSPLSFTAQANEILCKVLCHHLRVLIRSIYELGIEPIHGQGQKQESKP